MSRFLVLALAFLLMNSVSIGHAATIFSNGPVNLQVDMEASGADVQLADDFTLTAGNTTIRDVHWWGSTALVDGTFSVKIYEDANGLPGALIFDVAPTALSIIDTNVDNSLGRDVYYYSAVVEPIALSAETVYWLSVFHSGVWLWSHDHDGTAAERYPPDAWFSATTLRLAFELTDDGQIPTPATLALLGIGLAALGLARRRKAQ